MALTALDLIQNRGFPIVTSMNSAVVDALTLMLRQDYTQLPIVDNNKKQKGVVTSESILRAQINLEAPLDKLKVKHAATNAAKCAPDDNVFDVFELFNKHHAALVVDNEDTLMGIITPWDVVVVLQQRAEDLMLVEDIESAVKDHILASFTDKYTGILAQKKLDAAISHITDHSEKSAKDIIAGVSKYLVKAGVDHKPNLEMVREVFAKKIDGNSQSKGFSDLTLSQYIQLLLDNDRWKVYGQTFSLDSQHLRKLLDNVRETRNQLAHFRDEISEDQRGILKYCRDLFERHPVPEFTVALQPIELEANTEVSNDQAYEIVPVEDEIGPGESRYARLAVYLQQLPMNQEMIELTYEDIEKILEGALPPSAWEHRSWWANDTVSHVQSKQWLDAGWSVANVNISERRVKFARSKEREQAYIRFFSELLSSLEAKADFKVRELSPHGSSWHVLGWYKDQNNNNVAQLIASFSRDKRFRVEFYIDNGDKEYNTKLLGHFDAKSLIAAISQNYTDLLNKSDNTWLKDEDEDFSRASDIPPWDLKLEYLPNRRATRIVMHRPGFVQDNDEKLKIIRLTGVAMMSALKAALEPELKLLDISYYG